MVVGQLFGGRLMAVYCLDQELYGPKRPFRGSQNFRQRPEGGLKGAVLQKNVKNEKCHF